MKLLRKWDSTRQLSSTPRIRGMADRIEDLTLPNTVVAKIVKDIVPNGFNLSKEIRTAMSRAAAVFILYITSGSSSVANKNNRKLLTALDVLEALTDAELEKFVEPVKVALQEYKKLKKEKRDASAKRKQQRDSEKLSGSSGDVLIVEENDSDDSD